MSRARQSQQARSDSPYSASPSPSTPARMYEIKTFSRAIYASSRALLAGCVTESGTFARQSVTFGHQVGFDFAKHSCNRSELYLRRFRDVSPFHNDSYPCSSRQKPGETDVPPVLRVCRLERFLMPMANRRLWRGHRLPNQRKFDDSYLSVSLYMYFIYSYINQSWSKLNRFFCERCPLGLRSIGSNQGSWNVTNCAWRSAKMWRNYERPRPKGEGERESVS